MKTKGILIAIFLASASIFSSCSPKATNGTVPLKKGNVTGNWTLTNITYEGGITEGSIKTLFNEAPPKCFVNSSWSFTNSGNGSYNLQPSSGCTAKMQIIFWSVSPADETFQFKKLMEGQKAKDVTDGYRLVLSEATGSVLTLKTPIEVGSGAAYAVLHFTKL